MAMKQKEDVLALLVNPPFVSFYEGVPVGQGVPYSPVLSLPTVAAGIIRRGYQAHILDGNLHHKPFEAVKKAVRELGPEWVGISVVTPLWEEVLLTIRAVREANPNTHVVLGGPHVSALPRESIMESRADVIIIGEGDDAFADLMDLKKPTHQVPGVVVRYDNDTIEFGPERPYLRDLDSLPMPAWHLYDLKQYKTTQLLCRQQPVGWIETSRGCPFGCIYCSKHTFGSRFRSKSPERVVDEMAHMLDIGFREIHIADDCFSFKPERVRSICEEILKRNLKFPWAPVTGIRVDNLDEELLRLMRRAGCYRVYFGIESGNDEILKRIKKGISLDKIRETIAASHRVGMETFGFFMIALPGETEETMKQTRKFARELDLDMAKIAVTVPLPATPFYKTLEQENRLLTTKWSEFNLYRPARTIYEHDTLDWDTIEKHYRLFYRSFYLRPGFIKRRLQYALRYGTLWSDLSAFFRTRW